MEDPITVRVREYASQAVEYVRRALKMTLEYDSDTLPVLDHYLRTVTEGAQAEALELVITTAGCYFGEVAKFQHNWIYRYGEHFDFGRRHGAG